MTASHTPRIRYAANGIRRSRSANGIDRRALLGAFVGVAAAAGAPAAANVTREKKMQIAKDNLLLNIAASQSDSVVAIDYSVENRATAPVFLFNILHEEFKAGAYPLAQPNLYVEFDGRQVILGKKIVPPPPGTFVEKRNVPFVTRLLPGQSFRETEQIAIPLRVRTPYTELTGGQPTREVLLPYVFELGYFFGKPGTESLAKQYPTAAGPRVGFDPFPASSQHLIRSPAWGPVRVLL